MSATGPGNATTVLRAARWSAGVLGAAALLVAGGPLLAGCDDETGDAPLPVRLPAAAQSGPSDPYGPTPVPGASPAPSPPSPAPSEGPCPEGGVRVATGLVDSAMGLRAMEVSLANCGTRRVEVSGYPELTVLDGRSAPMESVTVHQGSNTDSRHRPTVFALGPGERAVAAVVWRNTVTLTDRPATEGVYLRVVPVPGAPGQRVRPGDGGPLDLGNTDRVEVTPWRPAAAD
ncbi:DUF4232 domain-containing protein [Streptomyces solincola]|uniref:DUF4232 domain-containing protein n=1 Tax=Streptomyces solincola TaxID=2100817 RepID=A0A2S9Q098_9ACTN|nr:DUF4232 domain-containing protein [Streptomyces solincola]PRH80068.1 DUF4232 domain-containing protein [Streptomyces solincola]